MFLTQAIFPLEISVRPAMAEKRFPALPIIFQLIRSRAGAAKLRVGRGFVILFSHSRLNRQSQHQHNQDKAIWSFPLYVHIHIIHIGRAVRRELLTVEVRRDATDDIEE